MVKLWSMATMQAGAGDRNTPYVPKHIFLTQLELGHGMIYCVPPLHYWATVQTIKDWWSFVTTSSA
jgi:hypothetical protein